MGPPPPPPKAKAKASTKPIIRPYDDDDIVDAVAAAVLTESPRSIPIAEMKDLVLSTRGKAQTAVRRASRESGEVWDDDHLARCFHKELKAVTLYRLQSHRTTDFGEKMVHFLEKGALHPPVGRQSVTASSSSSSTGTVYRPGRKSGVGEGNAGAPLQGVRTSTVLTLYSSRRNRNTSSKPNIIQVPLRGDEGFGLAEALQEIESIELVSIKLNQSSFFRERVEGVEFHVKIDEVTDQYSRQADGHDDHSQYRCSAVISNDLPGVKVNILTNIIRPPANFALTGTITAILLDDQKLPLDLEQDVYSILSTAWDDVNNRIVFRVPPHSVKAGDRMSIRGINCVEDPRLFNDEHNYHATPIDLTHIAIPAWKAAPRTITVQGSHLVCINNIVTLSIRIHHQV